jgi:hypothetical protein
MMEHIYSGQGVDAIKIQSHNCQYVVDSVHFGWEGGWNSPSRQE